MAGRACLPEGNDEAGQDLDLGINEDFGANSMDELPVDDEAA